MAIASEPATRLSQGTLQDLAKRHLWMHFTRHGAYEEADVPIIVRGEGCYVYDEHGNRYLDGLSALFCVNAGHGRSEIGEAMARQVSELDFFTVWSYAHPRAIELAARVAALAPGDLNRVFFTSGGSEAVESALKLARNYHRAKGNGHKTKVVARETAYHGTSLGALAATGIPALRTQFEPLTPGGVHVPNTDSFRWPADRDPLWAADQIEERILFEGPETVAAVILEPVQNAGGCIPPQEGYFQRVREICDRYEVLLISDEVICSWGRLGTWYGSERYGYRPDLITTAKALTSAYAPMGALIVSDRIADPFMREKAMFSHGFTFAGHPVAAAVALEVQKIYAEMDIVGRAKRLGPLLQATLGRLTAHPLVAELRGTGLIFGMELMRDRDKRIPFDAALGVGARVDAAARRHGLILRVVGDRLVFAPPLIIEAHEIEEIGARLKRALDDVADELTRERALQ